MSLLIIRLAISVTESFTMAPMLAAERNPDSCERHAAEFARLPVNTQILAKAQRMTYQIWNDFKFLMRSSPADVAEFEERLAICHSADEYQQLQHSIETLALRRDVLGQVDVLLSRVCYVHKRIRETGIQEALLDLVHVTKESAENIGRQLGEMVNSDVEHVEESYWCYYSAHKRQIGVSYYALVKK